MNTARNKIILYALILAATFIAPFLFPDFGTQLATLWLMIIVALTWDMTGGQMGYNSLGNIFFYGTGMYVAAVISIGLVYDVGDYTNAAGGANWVPKSGNRNGAIKVAARISAYRIILFLAVFIVYFNTCRFRRC